MFDVTKLAHAGALAALSAGLAFAQGPCGVWLVNSPATLAFSRVADLDLDRHVISLASPALTDIEIRRRDRATGVFTLEASLPSPLAAGSANVFGAALDLDGDRLAVLSVTPTGRPLRVYRVTASGWALEQEVAVLPPIADESYGLHLRGPILHVRSDVGVSVFELDPVTLTWNATQVVAAPGALTGFAADIDFDGRSLVVSDRLAHRAVAYRRTTQGTYEHVQDITSTNFSNQRFGARVELEDGSLVIASESSGSSSWVELFRFSPVAGLWLSGQILRDPFPPQFTPAHILGFGTEIALSRGGLLVTAPDVKVSGSLTADGALHVYKLEPQNNIFRLERSIVANSPSNSFRGQRFGVGIAYESGLVALQTQNGGDLHNGQFIFVPGTTDCDADNVPDACEILLGNAYDDNRNGFVDTCELSGQRYCTPGVTNSVGTAARMNVFGVPRTLLFYLDLVAGGLPPGAVGHFIASRGNQVVIDPAMWNGALCVGGAPIALAIGGPRVAGQDGSFAVVYNRPLLPIAGGLTQILPGETWHFQCWYQDQGATPSSSYSDAVAVTFSFL